jgi:hypothetical protein
MSLGCPAQLVIFALDYHSFVFLWLAGLRVADRKKKATTEGQAGSLVLWILRTKRNLFQMVFHTVVLPFLHSINI